MTQVQLVTRRDLEAVPPPDKESLDYWPKGIYVDLPQWRGESRRTRGIYAGADGRAVVLINQQDAYFVLGPLLGDKLGLAEGVGVAFLRFFRP